MNYQMALLAKRDVHVKINLSKLISLDMECYCRFFRVLIPPRFVGERYSRSASFIIADFIRMSFFLLVTFY